MNNKKQKTEKQELELAVNREYKDTVFRMLFSDRKNMLSLYNAMNGTSYENPEELEIVTLDNAIYMGRKNDLAFILNFHLYLYEHQSSYNPNMPLRNLFYIANEYQALVNSKSLYSSTIQKIPAPHFVVFYNGERKVKDYEEQKLSDAYEEREEDPALELKVMMLNINEGHNKELMEQCRLLKEYSQYVATVRRYAKTMDLKEAVEQAVRECIENDILREFLQKNRAEVISVSIFEYDKEKEEKMLREAEYEAGKTDGLEQGLKMGLEAFILDKIEEEIPEEVICKKIETRFGMDEKRAKEYFETFAYQKV